ncbi:hypothetical protein [Mycolicibacterium fortuitum]|uniref:RuvC-like resolvase n=1 Tax=Mycobacterium phage Bipper TaxID=1805457 RepID=A0A142F2L6_9CAUD|nr:hypothetical protein [Mycolicibacterium fortuitum]YP_009303235.1 RuvC-like Holliday junction resolvase [Mycobacterium phage Bipper]AMQ67023.1 RuvC-like resolvase [Mycobacterium phage Bipper]QDF19375.1 RuvC-like resolvase [Mycobacterium phage Cracklewink]UBV14842.1 hypothetical protein H8Z57_29815 [Mycolicibacterium fortuitum]
MIITGIDPSLTSAGIANFNNGRVSGLTSVGRKGHDSESYDDRSDRIDYQSQLVVSKVSRGCDLVMIEGPAYEADYGSQFDRAALWHFIYRRLRIARVPVVVVPPKVAKKFATDNGNASKELMRDHARRVWHDLRIRNADEADALWIGAYGVAEVGDWLPFHLEDHQLTVMRKNRLVPNRLKHNVKQGGR